MVLIQRVFVVCGRVARAVADSYRRVAHRPASTDDLTVESRGDVRPKAATSIARLVRRPDIDSTTGKTTSTKKHPRMRFEGALPKRREVVPRSFVKDAEGKRLLCGDFSRPPPRPSRSRLRRRRVCVCVCYNGGGARFSTPSRRIHRTSSRASGSRAAAVPRLGLNRRSVTSRDGYIRP